MSHKEQLEFINSVKSLFPSYFKNKKVLEVGSLDINGSVRDYFDDCFYIGIDVAEGKGVDVVARGESYSPLDLFDVTISCECFEHNPNWFETFQNMINLTSVNGLVIFTCATEGRPEHGTIDHDPGSSPLTVSQGQRYYRNLNKEDFLDKMNFSENFKEWSFGGNSTTHDLYFYGIVKHEGC